MYCGIDWSEQHHDIALVDEHGRLVAKGRIGDDMDGFTTLVEVLAAASDSALGRHLDLRRRPGTTDQHPRARPDGQRPQDPIRRGRAATGANPRVTAHARGAAVGLRRWLLSPLLGWPAAVGAAITTRRGQPNSPRCWPKLSRHRK